MAALKYSRQRESIKDPEADQFRKRGSLRWKGRTTLTFHVYQMQPGDRYAVRQP